MILLTYALIVTILAGWHPTYICSDIASNAIALPNDVRVTSCRPMSVEETLSHIIKIIVSGNINAILTRQQRYI